MSDVNPNVAVTDESTVEGGFGEDGLTSFDDIEAIEGEDSAPQAKSAEDPVEEVGKQAKGEEEEKLSEEQQEIVEEVEEELRMIKAMRGESEHEVPEDAVFVQKVNGEDTEVTLRDLLNDYSGKTDWTKKYNELGKDRQGLKQERFEFETRINTFVEKSKEDVVDALAYLAETAGADPVEFIKEMKQGLIPDLEQYMNMSQSEKEAYDSKQELSILKKSNETRSSQEQRLQEFKSLEEQTLAQIEELGVERQEYAAAYDRLVASGTVEADQIGPEAVAQWIGLENRVSLVDQTLMDLGHDMADDVALIEDLVRTSLEGGLDEQATVEVINELYGQPSKEAQSASKKARESGTNLKTAAKKIIEKDSESDYGSGPISFDDI